MNLDCWNNTGRDHRRLMLAVAFLIGSWLPQPTPGSQVAMVSLAENAPDNGADVRLQGLFGEELGFALAMGDLNGDGFSDLAAGAPEQGKVYVFFGGVSIDGGPSLSDYGLEAGSVSREVLAQNEADVVLTGNAAIEFGFSVAISPGGRLVIGAPDTDNLGVPRAWVVTSVAGLSGEQPVEAVGTPVQGSAGDQTGYAVAAGPVLGNDNDVVISARAANNRRGVVYILEADDFDLGAASTITGLRVNEGLGESLAIGDFLPMGNAELAIGAVGIPPNKVCGNGSTTCETDSDCPGESCGEPPGRVYVWAASMPGAARCIEGESSADFFGFSLTAGDFEGSPMDDLAVGAIYADRSACSGDDTTACNDDQDCPEDDVCGLQNAGAVYAFTNLDLLDTGCGNPAAAAARVFYGDDDWDQLGFSLATGDFRPDPANKEDLVVTARWHDRSLVLNEVDEGAVYVIFGGDGFTTWPANTDCPTEECTSRPEGVDVMILGGDYDAGSDELGFAVTAGDFNRDARDDLAVSSIMHDRVYLVSLENSDTPAVQPGQESDDFRNLRDGDDDGDGYLDIQEDCDADGSITPLVESDPLVANRDVGITIEANGSTSPAPVACDLATGSEGQIQVEITLTNHSPRLSIVGPGPDLTVVLENEIYNLVPSSLSPAGATIAGVIGGTTTVSWPSVPQDSTLEAGDSSTFSFTLRVMPDPGNTPDRETIIAAVDPVPAELDDNHCSPGSPNELTVAPNAAAATVQLLCPDLVVTKQDSADPVISGQQLTYSIGISNDGGASAGNVVATETLPADVAFVSTSGCANDPAGVPVCLLGTVAAGAIVDYTVTVDVPAGLADTTLSNSVEVAANEVELDSTNNSDSEETLIAADADLEISKVDLSDPVLSGEMLTYTVTVGNSGPSDAVNVRVTDMLPAGLSLISTAGCAEDPTGIPLCTLGDVSTGATAFFTIATAVDAGTSGTITNTATVASDTTDSNAANDSVMETTFVAANADLSILTEDSPDPITAGSTLTYQNTVNNAGPSEALDVTVTDTLPPEVTFVSTSGCLESPAGGVPLCTLGTLAGTDSATYTIMVTVNAGAAGTITNAAAVSSATPDDNPNNDTGVADTFVGQSADLAIGKTDSPDPVAPGGALTYTVSVNNLGPSNATNVRVTDALPSGVTLVSTSGCLESPGGGVPLCTLGDIPSSGAAAYDITVMVNPGTLGTTSNTATVLSDTTDASPANNTISEDTLVSIADLSLTKIDSADPVTPSQTFTYTLLVNNAGPSEAANVQVTETLPPEVTLVSTAGCAESPGGGVPTCTLGAIASGGSTSYDVTVAVVPGTLGTITNSATVSSDTPEGVPGDESASEETLVENADLSLSKIDTVDPVLAGQSLTYTVTVDNGGPSDAANVQVTDTLPGGVTLVSTTGCAEDPVGAPTCNLGGIPAGGTAAYDITVLVDPATLGTITNNASVTSDTLDGDLSNNSESENTLVDAAADLSISKVDSIDPVVRGSSLTYTVTVSNAGPSNALNVVTTDMLPAGVTFVSTTGCDEDPAGQPDCSLGTLPAGGSAVYDITVTVDVGTAGTITNSATVSSSTTEAAPGNESTSEDTVVTVSASQSRRDKLRGSDPTRPRERVVIPRRR